jgi:hypothetical protein
MSQRETMRRIAGLRIELLHIERAIAALETYQVLPSRNAAHSLGRRRRSRERLRTQLLLRSELAA